MAAIVAVLSAQLSKKGLEKGVQDCLALSRGDTRATWGICMFHVSSANPSNQGGNCFRIVPWIASDAPTSLKLAKSIPKLVCMLKLDVQKQLYNRD